MGNFKIYESGAPVEEPVHGYFEIGTRITFRMIGDRIKASISIPVQFA
jgi:hypothetical protein